MKNLLDFENFNESQTTKNKEGIHRAIRGILIKFIKNNKDCSFEQAKKHISSHVEGWELMKNDFDEAKKLVGSN